LYVASNIHKVEIVQSYVVRRRQSLWRRKNYNKCGHWIKQTDVEGSNGLDKGPRKMEVNHSYNVHIIAKWLASKTEDELQ